MSVRPLLIGQAPGPEKNQEPLCPRTRTGRRLLELMGVDAAFYLEHFDRINLVPRHPGRWKRDDRFPLRQARATADSLRPLLLERRVVLLGRNVATAFGLPDDAPYCRWRPWAPAWWRQSAATQGYVAVIPHPSGRCRWYNSEPNWLLAQEFLKSLADRVMIAV